MGPGGRQKAHVFKQVSLYLGNCFPLIYQICSEYVNLTRFGGYIHPTERARRAPKQPFEQTGYRYEAFRPVRLTLDQFEYNQKQINENLSGRALLDRLHTKARKCCAENAYLTALAGVSHEIYTTTWRAF